MSAAPARPRQGEEDFFDDDFEDVDCTVCGGDGVFVGADLPDYDPLWHIADRLYNCDACGGSGAAKDQTLW